DHQIVAPVVVEIDRLRGIAERVVTDDVMREINDAEETVGRSLALLLNTGEHRGRNVLGYVEAGRLLVPEGSLLRNIEPTPLTSRVHIEKTVAVQIEDLARMRQAGKELAAA